MKKVPLGIEEDFLVKEDKGLRLRLLILAALLNLVFLCVVRMPKKRHKNAKETVHKCHFHDASTALKESLIPPQCSLLNHPQAPVFMLA